VLAKFKITYFDWLLICSLHVHSLFIHVKSLKQFLTFIDCIEMNFVAVKVNSMVLILNSNVVEVLLSLIVHNTMVSELFDTLKFSHLSF
jgi:hypothetical protein